MFSKWFVRLNWFSLVLVFLVVIAGSFVRITGSGMGCPDWPKCFGSWVPPTQASELPKDYKEIYGEKRVKKVEKFAKFLRSLGMNETAERIKNDPSTYEEQAFNGQKTWIEYINRWAGFLAGNSIIALLIWILLRYRKDKRLLRLAIFTLIAISLNGWFGSIVVATNLVPWTITVHLFLAILVILLQLMMLRRVAPSQSKTVNLTGGMKILIVLILLITTYQLFLGTQVREYIDELTKQGIGREEWTDQLGWSFFIHRSFSWLVLILLVVLTYLNMKTDKFRAIYTAFILLALELICGVALAYGDMPGFVQVCHLFFATVLFGVLTAFYLRIRPIKNPLLARNSRI